MDIVQLSEDFYPIKSGGALTDTEVAKTAAQNHNVTVFTFSLDDSPDRERHHGITIHRPVKPFFQTLPGDSPFSDIGRITAAIFLGVYVLLHGLRNNVDVIYSTNNLVHPIAKALSTLTGAPLVTFVAYTPSLRSEELNLTDPLYAFEQFNFRWMLGETIHCRNPDIRDQIAAYNPTADVRVTHGVVNADRVRSAAQGANSARDSVRDSLGVSSSTTLLAWVGRFTPLKRPDLAVEVLADLPNNYELVFVGDGPRRGLVETVAEREGITGRIHLRGELSHKDTIQTVLASDGLLLTSTAESYPTVVFEALCCSCLTIATPVGILPELGCDFDNLVLAQPDEMSAVIRNYEFPESTSEVDHDLLDAYSVERFTKRVCSTFEKYET